MRVLVSEVRTLQYDRVLDDAAYILARKLVGTPCVKSTNRYADTSDKTAGLAVARVCSTASGIPFFVDPSSTRTEWPVFCSTAASLLRAGEDTGADLTRCPGRSVHARAIQLHSSDAPLPLVDLPSSGYTAHLTCRVHLARAKS